MKILITDIDSDIISDVSSSVNLLMPDCELSVINSGKECLNAIKNSHCADIVITGMHLSDMTWLELVIQIRDDSDIPIIFISGNNEIATLVKAFEAGVDDYVVSPFNKAIFISRLKALIRRTTPDIPISTAVKNKFRAVYQSSSGEQLC
jgi:DNA-binding response OmpR family regulator